MHGVGDVGAEAAEGVESQSSDLVAAGVPCAAAEGVRHVLREDAHGVLSGGDDSRVVHALEVELAPELVGKFAAPGGGEAGLPFGLGERRVDLAVVVRLERCPGAR